MQHFTPAVSVYASGDANSVERSGDSSCQCYVNGGSDGFSLYCVLSKIITFIFDT